MAVDGWLIEFSTIVDGFRVDFATPIIGSHTYVMFSLSRPEGMDMAEKVYKSFLAILTPDTCFLPYKASNQRRAAVERRQAKQSLISQR